MPCPSGKIRYRDRLGAMIALSQIDYRSQKAKGRKERRPYRCPQCAGWHLTSQKR
jgi:hypothetical protein